jgi:hypothetical protein
VQDEYRRSPGQTSPVCIPRCGRRPTRPRVRLAITRNNALVVAVLVLATGTAFADIKFTQLDEDQFVVYHRKHSLLGTEAKATSKLYEEIASICVAAEFEYFSVKQLDVQERHAGGFWGGGRGAGASAEVKFHHEEGPEADDRVKCMGLADQKSVDRARKKLRKH